MQVASNDGAALVDELTEAIRQRIMSGEYPVGAALRQSDLAAQFGTSRTPVREALRQLQSSGLIQILPNRGAMVRIPAPWEVRDLYEVRAELEALAARRAATRLTKADFDRMRHSNDALFELTLRLADEPTADGHTDMVEEANQLGLHVVINEAAGNAQLSRLLGNLSSAFPSNVPAMLLVENARHRENNHDEHARIIDALEAGDGALAAELMRAHVRNTGEQIARWYEQRSQTVLLAP
ncbi:MAG: GntR family transcriptional regulator [Bifidobacteriaceae bacterium]|nr:GntR family transcriptional regulator [Bifidobacteriaceae bacterium]